MRILDAALVVQRRGNLPCCEAVARILRLAADVEDDPKLKPGSAWWDAMMIMDPKHPFSNVPATGLMFGTQAAPYRIIEKGKVDDVLAAMVPGRWHAIQGWRSLPLPSAGIKGSGHNFLWLASAVDIKYGWLLESSINGGWVINDPHQDTQPSLFSEKAARYIAGVGIVPLSLDFQ